MLPSAGLGLLVRAREGEQADINVDHEGPTVLVGSYETGED
jgi:hypothetical protein